MVHHFTKGIEQGGGGGGEQVQVSIGWSESMVAPIFHIAGCLNLLVSNTFFAHTPTCLYMSQAKYNVMAKYTLP